MPSNSYSYDVNSDISFETISNAIEVVFYSLSFIFILTNQIGYSFLESGSVRAKNIQSIEFKNLIEIIITVLIWWLLGYSLAYGSDIDGFIGQPQIIENRLHWLFTSTFACTQATILTGCVSERMTIPGYALYNIFQTSWVYPVVVHWVWGQGWLQKIGYHDFSGGSTVHILGGFAGLLATIKLGPRIGRFDKTIMSTQEFKPSNLAYIVLGTLLIWFSMYTYNIGSLQSIILNSHKIPTIGINTTLAGFSAGIAAFFIQKIFNFNQLFLLQNVCSGMLSGLISVTVVCDDIHFYASFILGILSALLFQVSKQILFNNNVDDPVDFIAINLGSGSLGVLYYGLFDIENGIFYGGSGEALGIQMLGLIAILFWVGINNFFFLFVLSKLNLLRISAKAEKDGIDSHYFGGSPYNYDMVTLKLLTKLQKLQNKMLAQRKDKKIIIDIEQVTPVTDKLQEQKSIQE